MANNDIEIEIARIEGSRNDIIRALQNIGVRVLDNTPIHEIAYCISTYGVFRGTMKEYETMFAAGNIPVGTVVVIDED